MDRYVALIWDSHSRTSTEQARECREAMRMRPEPWRVIAEIGGCAVFAPAKCDARALVWPDGLILGQLYRRHFEGAGRVRQFRAGEVEAIHESGGKALAANFWGNYVAIWQDRDGCQVFRDPCGALPAFSLRHGQIDLVFSHAGDIADAPSLALSVDWQWIQAYLVFNYFATPHTGFREIKEILPGQRRTRRAQGEWTSAWLWRGDDIAAQPDDRKFEDIAQDVLRTASSSFGAWASSYSCILASLSGGLDSSAMVALLAAQNRAEVVGLHFRGVDYEAYETDLARLAARHCGVRLAEITQLPAEDAIWRNANADLLARPRKQALAVQIDDLSLRVAREIGAEAFMIGQGGDNLFLQGGAAHWLVQDAWLAKGYAGAVEAARAATRLNNRSYAHIVASALRSPRFVPYSHLAGAPDTLITPSAIQALPADYQLHPWLQDIERLSPGKAEHLGLILALYHYYIHFGRGMTHDVVFPFFSQPLVELALRTPLLTLAHGGLDRALERHAFRDLLPGAVRHRTSKGVADRYLHQVLRHNAPMIRKTLCKSPLWDHAWLNRKAILAMLDALDAGSGKYANAFFVLLAVDTWLRTWESRGARL